MGREGDGEMVLINALSKGLVKLTDKISYFNQFKLSACYLKIYRWKEIINNVHRKQLIGQND